MNTFTLDLQSIELTQDQFYQLCVNNRDLHIERNANGDLVIMPRRAYAQIVAAKRDD